MNQNGHLAAADASDEDARLSYQSIESPVGRLLLIASPRGMLRVAFECEGFDAVLAALPAAALAAELRGESAGQESAQILTSAMEQLGEYFAGVRRQFDLRLDHGGRSGFAESVRRALPSIKYGQTRSYRELAQQLGRPGAVRAVGSACATNPLPILVPCHRVLRSDGSLGGYRGGLDAKRVLLELEHAALG